MFDTHRRVVGVGWWDSGLGLRCHLEIWSARLREGLGSLVCAYGVQLECLDGEEIERLMSSERGRIWEVNEEMRRS